MWAQPTFETIESNIKACVIKRRQWADSKGTAGAETAPKHEAADEADHKPSPFDRPASTTGPHPHHELHVLPPVAEGGDLEGADVEGAVSGLTPAQSGSVLRSRGMSARTSAAWSSSTARRFLTCCPREVGWPPLHAVPLGARSIVAHNVTPLTLKSRAAGWKPPRRVSMGQHSDNASGQLPGLARHSAAQ